MPDKPNFYEFIYHILKLILYNERIFNTKTIITSILAFVFIKTGKPLEIPFFKEQDSNALIIVSTSLFILLVISNFGWYILYNNEKKQKEISIEAIGTHNKFLEKHFNPNRTSSNLDSKGNTPGEEE